MNSSQSSVMAGAVELIDEDGVVVHLLNVFKCFLLVLLLGGRREDDLCGSEIGVCG